MTKVTVAFDVDGTLLDPDDGSPTRALEDMRDMLRILSGLENTYIVVWSGSGKDYAEYMGRQLLIWQWVDEYAAKGTTGLVDIAFDDEEVTLATVNLKVKS